MARVRVGAWHTARTARAFTPHLKGGHGGCPSCGKRQDTLTHFVGDCDFFGKIREKQLQPGRFTDHLQRMIASAKGGRKAHKVRATRRASEATTWVPLLLGASVKLNIGGGESQEFNYLELSVKASSDNGVKKKEGRNKAVTDLLKHQRRLARYMAKAMGHRNGHLWTEYPKTRSNRFECLARKRALKKRARRAARDKQLRKSAEGRKQLRTRQRLKDQRSHPRRKALTRAAKTQLNRLAHQAKKDLGAT